jgi:hypothetical protein
MSVSNKTLAVMLLAAIVVSLGGTFISLNRLGAISTTGYSTSDGTVNLEIETNLQITTDNSNINFGECVLGENAAGFTINSETSGGNVNGNCSTYTNVTMRTNGITIRNSGNVNARIEIKTSKVGTERTGSFLTGGSTNSDIAYKVLNVSTEVNSVTYQGGCMSGLAAAGYNPFMAANTDYVICNNLTTTPNSIMRTHYEIVVPTAVPTGDSVLITFTGSGAV